MVFIGKLDEHPWAEMKNGIPKNGVATVSFPLCPKDSGADKKWDDIMASAEPIKNPVKRTLDEMATIIYTSGSTGQ
jgi:long-chain acyl-CoA synthetase